MSKKGIILMILVISLCSLANKFVPDGYSSISNKMLKQSNKKIESGELISFDKSWFSNDTLQQTLVFELYTDYHRLASFHFQNNEIPEELINSMELHLNDGQLATREQKQIAFNGFISKATKTNKFHFVTDKGFKLGDSKQKAVNTYGKPDKISLTKGIEKCEWIFQGDAQNTESPENKIANNSFGHRAIMYIKNNRIIGIVFYNDIP